MRNPLLDSPVSRLGCAFATAVGLAVGLPIALMMGRVMDAVLVDVSGFDPLTFVIAPLVLSIAAMVASYIPARRATQVNPLTALRTE